MKRIFCLLLLAIAGFANAASDTQTLHSMGFNDLPEAERAAIMAQVASTKQKLANEKNAPLDVKSIPSTPQKVNEWLDIGTKIGQMFGGAAREVGVAVNDFVKTPVGMWTMAIIIWKFMGGVIIHLVAGISVMIIGTFFAYLIYRAGARYEIQYDTEKKNYFGNYPIKHKERLPHDSDYTGWASAVQIVTMAVSLICIFTY